MTKEKLVSLKRYLDDLTNKLGTTPTKHKDHPKTYEQFLRREIAAVKGKLEAAALEGTGK